MAIDTLATDVGLLKWVFAGEAPPLKKRGLLAKDREYPLLKPLKTNCFTGGFGKGRGAREVAGVAHQKP